MQGLLAWLNEAASTAGGDWWCDCSESYVSFINIHPLIGHAHCSRTSGNHTCTFDATRQEPQCCREHACAVRLRVTAAHSMRRPITTQLGANARAYLVRAAHTQAGGSNLRAVCAHHDGRG